MIDDLGPFAEVLDVGGNVGEFAEQCRLLWPEARITSFEPLPQLVELHRERARGRWFVHDVALGASKDMATIHACVNQHSASSLLEHGPARRERFGITDQYRDIEVPVCRLDDLEMLIRDGRVLLKVDVEGFELEVLRGARKTLAGVDVAVVEVNQDPDIFVGAPTFLELDRELSGHGLTFGAVAGVQLDPQGRVVQFDGVWSRLEPVQPVDEIMQGRCGDE